MKKVSYTYSMYQYTYEKNYTSRKQKITISTNSNTNFNYIISCFLYVLITVVPNRDLCIRNEPAKMVIDPCLYMFYECKKV